MTNIPLIEIEEIIQIIKNSKVDSTSGITSISPKVIKAYPEVFAEKMIKIFNLSLSSGKFPSAWSWKEGIVTPIYKNSGAKSDPNNYRPISALPYVSKIYEKFLAKVILNHLAEKNLLLNEYQYGFRKGRSTFQAIVDLTQRVYNFLEDKCFTSVIFLDLT